MIILLIGRLFMRSFDNDLFIQFLEEYIIPYINSFPNIRFILIMNNVKIYHDMIYFYFYNN